MPKLKSPIPVHRISIPENEIIAVIDALSILATKEKLHPDAQLFLSKLNIHSIKNRIGLVKPSYVQTGRPEGAVTLESLSQMQDDSVQYREVSSPPLIETYTLEQKTEAEFAAADHFISTGEKRPWQEFVPSHPAVPSVSSIPSSSQEN